MCMQALRKPPVCGPLDGASLVNSDLAGLDMIISIQTSDLDLQDSI